MCQAVQELCSRHIQRYPDTPVLALTLAHPPQRWCSLSLGLNAVRARVGVLSMSLFCCKLWLCDHTPRTAVFGDTPTGTGVSSHPPRQVALVGTAESIAEGPEGAPLR